MLLQMLSGPIFWSKPDFVSTLRTWLFTPERIKWMFSDCDRRKRLSKLCKPVESINDTLRMRMMRIFGLSPMFFITLSNLLATPKKNGPSISYTSMPLASWSTSSS